jgi:carbon monoxide dehydrogenase subunit G
MALHFQGTLTIKAPQDKVWTFLLDPRAVSRCLPDVQSLEVAGDGAFRAVVRVGISLIRGNFTFDVAMEELDAPRHARVRGRGSGLGSAVDVDSRLDLTDGDGETTRLDWQADVVVSGTIAGVGARLLSSTVEKKAGELFECLRTQVEA